MGVILSFSKRELKWLGTVWPLEVLTSPLATIMNYNLKLIHMSLLIRLRYKSFFIFLFLEIIRYFFLNLMAHSVQLIATCDNISEAGKGKCYCYSLTTCSPTFDGSCQGYRELTAVATTVTTAGYSRSFWYSVDVVQLVSLLCYRFNEENSISNNGF